MILPDAPPTYDSQNERETRRSIGQADDANHKAGQDIEVGPGVRVIFTDAVTGVRMGLTVASGSLVLTPV